MPETPKRQRKPRFNHVAMSVPAELLSASGRTELVRFYEDVFGWTEIPSLTENDKRLVLQAYRNDQFVFLVADPNPMTCPRMDHFGMSVGSLQELEGMLERARKFKEQDDRVEIVDPNVDDFKVLKLHNFYLRYRLPLMIEVQYYDWSTSNTA